MSDDVVTLLIRVFEELLLRKVLPLLSRLVKCIGCFRYLLSIEANLIFISLTAWMMKWHLVPNNPILHALAWFSGILPLWNGQWWCGYANCSKILQELYFFRSHCGQHHIQNTKLPIFSEYFPIFFIKSSFGWFVLQVAHYSFLFNCIIKLATEHCFCLNV